MEKPNLRDRLESIKELKAEYCIGSWDAYDYLKSQDKYRELRDSVSDELRKKGIKYNIHLKEFARLCEIARGITQEEVGYIFDKDELDNSRRHKTIFITPFMLEDSRPIIIQGFGRETIPLNFDYSKFISEYFIKKISEGSSEEFDISIMKDILNSAQPLFEGFYPDTVKGKNYTLNDLLELEEFRHVKEDSDLELFSLSYEDLTNHEERINEIIKNEVNQSCTLEERKYLLKVVGSFTNKGDLYDRARREGILHKLDVERRVALFYVLVNTSDNENPQERINRMISLKEEEICGYSRPDFEKRTIVIMSEGSEEEAKEAFKKNAEEEILPRAKYLRKALIKNRKWLKEFLSR